MGRNQPLRLAAFGRKQTHNKAWSASGKQGRFNLATSNSERLRRLKAFWRLPILLREIFGTCYALPAKKTRREAILIVLVSTELSGRADHDQTSPFMPAVGLN